MTLIYELGSCVVWWFPSGHERRIGVGQAGAEHWCGQLASSRGRRSRVLSVVTLAEIRRGIELMQRGRRRDRLTAWLEDELSARFDGRLLDVDRRAADQWGVLMARSRSARFALATIDGFIAATARAHGLTLVTRNVRDFDRMELSLFDPWEQPGP